MNKDIGQLVENIDELLETDNLSALERKMIMRQLDDRLIESVLIKKEKQENNPYPTESKNNKVFGFSDEENKRLNEILDLYENSR